MDNPSPAVVSRSTLLSEVTFFAALVAVVAIIFTLIWALVHMNDAKSLGVMIWLMGGGLVLIIAACASPWIGTIKFTAGATGVTGEIDGDAEHKS